MKPSILSVVYVVVQFATSAILVLTVSPASLHVVGLALSAAGIVVSASAIATLRSSRLSMLPEVRAGSKLITHGPYRYVRHPMYTGLLLFTAGTLWMPFRWWRVALWLLLAIDLFLKVRHEERLLQQRFPEYAQYSQKTRRFLPFVI